MCINCMKCSFYFSHRIITYQLFCVHMIIVKHCFIKKVVDKILNSIKSTCILLCFIYVTYSSNE